MNKQQYREYVLAECERQWHDCQEEFYGPWEEQTEDTQAEYYNEMYELLKEDI